MPLENTWLFLLTISRSQRVWAFINGHSISPHGQARAILVSHIIYCQMWLTTRQFSLISGLLSRTFKSTRITKKAFRFDSSVLTHYLCALSIWGLILCCHLGQLLRLQQKCILPNYLCNDLFLKIISFEIDVAYSCQNVLYFFIG